MVVGRRADTRIGHTYYYIDGACLMSHFHFAGAVNLLPSDITVEQGNYAVFNCSYGCQIMQTHTLSWVVGDLPGIRRTFLRGRTTDFIEKSGLYVEVSDQSTCERDGLDHGKAVEQLRINASSAMLYNRTAVQCVAFPTIDGDQTFFSSYGLLVINVPGEPNASGTLRRDWLNCPSKDFRISPQAGSSYFTEMFP